VYSHDTTNQLTGADRSGTDESYSYDLNGNRSISGYATATDNRVSSGAGYTFTYYNEGNMTARTKVVNGEKTHLRLLEDYTASLV
jgi:hypothetical protein